MSVDMFLKVEKINGESKDDKHKDEIDVLAWQWGMNQSGTFHIGGGGGAGKVNINDVNLTKYIDASSHALQLACAKGTHIGEMLLTVRKAGDKPLEYITIKMKKVMVTSIAPGGSGGEDRLTESVTFNFAQVEYSYYPQKADGSGDTAKEFKWDIEANKQL